MARSSKRARRWVFFGGLALFEELEFEFFFGLAGGEGGVAVFFLLFDFVFEGALLFGAVKEGAFVFVGLLEVGDFLTAFFGFGFEDEGGAGFDGVVVHLLEFVGGEVATVDDFGDVVTDAFGAALEFAVGGHFVEGGGFGFEVFELALAGEADDVGGEGVDEVGDGVVGLGEHALDVLELEEEHHAHGDEGFVGGADSFDIEIHLVGDDA